MRAFLDRVRRSPRMKETLTIFRPYVMEDGLKCVIRALPILLLTLASCSWLDSVERKLVGDDEPRPPSRRQTVPKAQYDDLLSRFEALKREHEALKDGKNTQPLLSDLKETPVISNEGNASPQVETVDVFPNAAASPMPPVASGDMEEQVAIYHRALAMKAQNQGEAMKLFTQLVRSSAPAVKVRAQFQMGEILMAQGEYDLAMQAFDEIVGHQAFSGVVLGALRNLVVCADKLGLAQKKDQYQSLLRDVFQIGT